MRKMIEKCEKILTMYTFYKFLILSKMVQTKESVFTVLSCIRRVYFFFEGIMYSNSIPLSSFSTQKTSFLPHLMNKLNIILEKVKKQNKFISILSLHLPGLKNRLEEAKNIYYLYGKD
jgi:hypothetical protein